MLRMSTRWTESGRPQGRPLRWTDGRAQCGAIGTVVDHLKAAHKKCYAYASRPQRGGRRPRARGTRTQRAAAEVTSREPVCRPCEVCVPPCAARVAARARANRRPRSRARVGMAARRLRLRAASGSARPSSAAPLPSAAAPPPAPPAAPAHMRADPAGLEAVRGAAASGGGRAAAAARRRVGGGRANERAPRWRAACETGAQRAANRSAGCKAAGPLYGGRRRAG